MTRKYFGASCNYFEKDLDHIFANTENLWSELRGERIFITGGTGFFGTWLLESLIWANEKLDLNVEVLALTRNPEHFKKRHPHLANNKAIKFYLGDIRDFEYPEGDFSYIIHGASTSSVEKYLGADALTRYQITADGTKRVLEFSSERNVKKFLLISSGAVYGEQPSDIENITESSRLAPITTDVDSCYGEAKRVAELMCTMYAKKYGFETKIARCFSFIGPYFPMDIHFAIGNFIKAGINGGPILVNGDGTPVRSYMYSSDLIIWLWTILFKGASCVAYNVGSEESISIAELANVVARCFQKPVEVRLAKSPALNGPPDRYVPSTKRAQADLGLRQTVKLKDAIERTINHFDRKTPDELYYENLLKLQNTAQAITGR